ncbi:hypothetical protein NC653_028753 [Populus alba x Populus x berolinensis]|uniref:Uncharacterized protein n=1 Tax=Populus alba x Populus x berolinensis TaxID=444605 RepID=A0AAD6Q3Q7_9ROSI|nr:hypothetical protein NC653_028753 [Populus alba x Populus x berolinensis]
MHPNWGPEKNFTVKTRQIKVLSFRLSKITQDSRKRNLSLGYRFSFLFIVLASWHSQEFLDHFYIFSVAKKDEISGFHNDKLHLDQIHRFPISVSIVTFWSSDAFFLASCTEFLSCEKAADNQARSPINLHFVKLPFGVFK